MNKQLQVEWLSSIDTIGADAWNALRADDYPFLQHAFLAALEHSGAVSAESGWLPQHLLLRRGDKLVAALPLYLKTHSYGEYVFDWAWADAWQRGGLAYYPKLLCAIPFTPATGPRVLFAAHENPDALLEILLTAIKQRVSADALSSFHLLFPDRALRERAEADGLLQRLGLVERMGAQYHWHNRDYQTFDDFLATFNSRKRKALRKERQRVAEQGLTVRVLEGAEISAANWSIFYDFYRQTYAKRSGHGGYLGLEFFTEIGRTLSDQVVLMLADWQGEVVAGALNFKDGSTLYGRYWGCSREFEFLHFETCYYRGIEYCIANGLSRFDPGAQGEHKIQRGFEPVPTYSYHWLEHAQGRRVVADFVRREQEQMVSYLHEAAQLLPFRETTPSN